jgi:hypothetical protein
MLLRTLAMLTKRLERFDPDQFRVRESPSVLPFEHEHDDEHEHDQKKEKDLPGKTSREAVNGERRTLNI